MPYFFLPPGEVGFPPAHFADIDGLLAQGGDIRPDWLLAGYRNGAFLWASPMEPLKWWSPDPRVVLYPEQLQVPQEIQALLEASPYETRFSSDLPQILAFCESIENKKMMYPGWITPPFKEAYLSLEQMGFVRSVGLWQKDQLIAAAFGVQIGPLYFGEHVCSTVADGEAIALALLAQKLGTVGVSVMDVHRETNLCMDIGFEEISRNEYLDLLKKGLEQYV
jgi:leucyl/phenylalanyl-tRNA--protein transferase